MSGQQLTVQGPNSSRTLHLSADSSTDAAAPIFSEEWLGSELWPAAPALVRVLERPEWRARLQSSASTVVELGAGTGAVGLAASVLGAGAVLVTDLPSVLPTLRHNVRANGLDGCVRCEELSWVASEDELPAAFAPDGAEMVLGSDLLNPVYGEEHAERLAVTVAALLSRCAAHRRPVALLAQTERGEGVAERAFRAACARHGLEVALESRSTQEGALPIHVLRLRPARWRRIFVPWGAAAVTVVVVAALALRARRGTS
jgi:predicted nicotinamide N-methyase